MILWDDPPVRGPITYTAQGLFPLGQIAPPDPTPTDNQEKRMVWMWDPGPGWLPGAIPVESPENPVPLIPLGNRIGLAGSGTSWMP